MIEIIISLLEVLTVLLPILISVAIITIVERKELAYTQRRVGPNTVGYYGILQPFADALKLILKENLIPQHVNKTLFLIAPCISLIAALLGWAVIPFGDGIVIADFTYGVLYSLAISSFSIYGIFLSGWASNNKFAFLGSLRATAQIVSYELVLTSAILAVVFFNANFDYIFIIENQKILWNLLPLFPFFIMFFISALAELNRTPIDLVEAESELVSGYFTEYSSVVFVFFFLAEYCSIVLISGLTAIFFIAGYSFIHFLYFFILITIIFAIKTCFFCILIVLVRSSLPRSRYDQLIKFIWLGLLPLAIAILISLPSLLMSFSSVPVASFATISTKYPLIVPKYTFSIYDKGVQIYYFEFLDLLSFYNFFKEIFFFNEVSIEEFEDLFINQTIEIPCFCCGDITTFEFKKIY